MKTVRSPHRRLVVGDQVEIRGNRLHLKASDNAATLADANANASVRPLR